MFVPLEVVTKKPSMEHECLGRAPRASDVDDVWPAFGRHVRQPFVARVGCFANGLYSLDPTLNYRT
jgi:hypothetical protein